MIVLFVLLALALLRNLLLIKTYRSVPVLELKRRARKGDKRAAALYKVAAYGELFQLRQWLFCTAAAAVLVIWATRTDWWAPVIVSVVISALIAWPGFSADGWAGALAALCAPFDAKILSLIKPILGPIIRWLPLNGPRRHTGIYEKNDFLELINHQNRQADNRIDESDLKIAFNALQFGDKIVGSVMTPRRKVKMVSAEEVAGPILTDELHKTGFSRFPVVKDSVKAASPQVIGTLYLNDLIGYQGSGRVRSLAKRDVYFINEESNLRQALNAFLRTHHQLLIVVNSFEEMVGVLTLEDLLEQIVGKRILDEFDSYDSLRAVASLSKTKAEPPKTTTKV